MPDIHLYEERVISVMREDANFDRACDSAMRMASSIFGSQDGHLMNVVNSERSRDSIQINFQEYQIDIGPLGAMHYYTFVSKVISNE